MALTYLTCLAVVDGLFNRLIFREDRKLSYTHQNKIEIYARWEWKYIGIFYLLFLGLGLPIMTSFFLGGVRYVEGYLLIFALFQWDVIFGKMVFNDWWADEPSIFLPKFGRVWMSLGTWISLNLVIAVVIGIFMF